MTAGKHLVIAGTGRAGTSFLVEFLAEAGLDCGTFTRSTEYHPAARAGWERRLDPSQNLPYVVKDPWLFTYCHDVDPALIDVLVVPVRDLDAAAGSRLTVDAAARHGDHLAWTPGGALVHYSAVADALARGFYELVQWATVHDVELVLLDFPRIVTDPAYLVGKLDRWLSRDTLGHYDAHRKAVR